MAAPDGHPLLRLDRLSKRFGDRLAVEALTLEVPPGELYGLIGPNGSGKTTTVKMIAGLYRPTAGQVLIAGIDLRAEPERAKGLLGYIPDEPFVYEKMTGREFLGLVAALYRVPEPERTRRIGELLDLYALGPEADGYVEYYSRGNRQKLAILASLLHAPRLLVVDEPIVGLDPESAIRMRDILRRFAESGGSALLCTHTLPFAEQVCHRVGLLKEGRLVEEGDLAALRRRAGLPDASLEALYLHFTKARPS